MHKYRSSFGTILSKQPRKLRRPHQLWSLSSLFLSAHSTCQKRGLLTQSYTRGPSEVSIFEQCMRDPFYAIIFYLWTISNPSFLRGIEHVSSPHSLNPLSESTLPTLSSNTAIGQRIFSSSDLLTLRYFLLLGYRLLIVVIIWVLLVSSPRIRIKGSHTPC